MTSLSLCVIARNEGELLARALNSARGGFDELIVVDTGSIKDVPELQSHGARVVPYQGPLAPDGTLLDFAQARNTALAHVRTTWWWWMDADEVALSGTVERLRRHAMERSEPVLHGVTHDGRTRWYRARLVRSGRGHEWVGACHEWVRGPGPARSDPGVVFEHRPRSDRGTSSLWRNYRILRNEMLSGRGSPREAFYLALTLSSLGQHDAAIAAWRYFFALPDWTRLAPHSATCILHASCTRLAAIRRRWHRVSLRST